MKMTIELENVNAQTGRVNELMRRYRQVVAPDCEVLTEADRCWYRAVAWGCVGLMLPPFLLLSVYYVIKAKKEVVAA